MKRIFGICLILIVIVMMTGCVGEGSKEYEEHTGYLFKKIEGTECLYYDTDTKIVYVIFNEFSGNLGYGYMSVYYAENGLPYRYVDGKLKEIDSGGSE